MPYCLTGAGNLLKLRVMANKVGIFRIMVASGLLLAGWSLALPQQATEYLQLHNLTGTRGGNLVVPLDSDPPSFNRMMATGLAHGVVTDRISGDLVHVNRATFELEPALASRWEVSKDGRTYTVHLRRGLRFSDGSPCDADDVLFTMQALQDPKTGSALADQVKIDGVFPAFTKVDSHTFKITFQRPVGMGLRAFDIVPILPRSRLLKAYQEGRFASAWGPTVQPGEVAGMGPFRLKEYQRGVKVVLERNPYYWKKDQAGQVLPYLDTITFLIIKDRNAEALRFQAGELDLLNILSPENYALLRRSQSQGQYVVQDLGPGLRIDYLWFNLNTGADRASKVRIDPEKQAIFEKPEFRHAVSLALDRDGIVRSLYLGLATPQFGPISSGNKPWYDPKVPRTTQDPERARRILAQLGLTDSNGDGIVEYGSKRRPLEISILTASGVATRERAAQVVKDNLTKIGIRAEVQLLSRNELIARFLNNFDYEAVLFGFGATDVIPELLTDVWYSSAKNHFWHPEQAKPHRPWEAEIDTLTTRLIQSIDPAARRAAFFQIQQIWAREMPAIPILAENVLVAWNNKVGNIRPSILSQAPQLLWNVEELTMRGR
jgi:peptide/nickel transport system substrate-binding protein